MATRRPLKKSARRRDEARAGSAPIDLAEAITLLAKALDHRDTGIRDERPRSQQELAERDAITQGLQERIRALEAQVVEAEGTRAWLQSALDAERQARQRLENERAENYLQLIRRVTTTVAETLPADATVLVVSRGDDRLLQLAGRQGWHFPQADDGRFAGHYPADSSAAIAHLEDLRDRGAQYLLLPATSRWWLEHYVDLRRHLETRYSLVRQDDACHLFSLKSDVAHRGPIAEIAAALESFESSAERAPAILDWSSGLDLASRFPGHQVFSPPPGATMLPYLDGTIDIVVCSPAQAESCEPRRVAAGAVITVSGESHDRQAAVDWTTPTKSVDASIIIPCHNGSALTDACLRAVSTSLPRTFGGQIVVVDDASTDDTRAVLRRWATDPRITILRLKTNRGFIAACNAGAKAATGKYLVFLNNDTEPSAGWLTALLRTFITFPDAGAVGGKLVLPGGELQEAGGVIFSDGSAANFARGERDLQAPLINYVREVDYCSGALLATPRALFDEIGGFDELYKPAYYEDVDYCFRVRSMGRGVYYQPASRVLHREGGTCGTDVARGIKRYQVLNQRKFAARWRQELRRQPRRPADSDRAAWQALAARQGFEAPARS